MNDSSISLSSLDMQEQEALVPPAADNFPVKPPSSRVRTSSAPQHVRNHLTTATFQRAPLLSPLRTSFVNGHSRGKSSSTPYPPPPPFMTTSYSAPEAQQKQPHHHRRIHSRNLSIFFPRPGGSSLPTSTIAEDGSQELSIPVDEDAAAHSPATSSVAVARGRHGGPITPLGRGFTFGSRPPGSTSSELTTAPRTTSSSSTTSRRGHHHKHSLSHNFFSFLEPTLGEGLSNNSANSSSSSGSEAELHTQPTPTPISPWGPAITDSAELASSSHGHSHSSPPPTQKPLPLPLNLSLIGLSAPLSLSLFQFTLGASLWVRGQQIGSLACTGLGYWVVFDAFGVMLGEVVPGWLASKGSSSMGSQKIRRPYGNGRLKTVLMFAQAVYLMFAAVYVCKETVEHILLGMGEGEGHHHHAAEEVFGLGINFPIFMTFIAFVSVLGTAILFNNNSKIVNITGNWISLSHPFFHLFKSPWSPSPPSTRLGVIFSNPFIASPLLFCTLILSVALFVHPTHHRISDLMLALLIALVTFKVAYRASVVLGTVLLQTSPPRGSRGRSGGNEDGLKMDAFWGAVKEVERHPHVLDLPAPHIWQLTPSLTTASWMTGGGKRQSNPEDSDSDSYVVALEIHVKEDLGDDELIKLTEWVWGRCVGALGGVTREGGKGEGGGPEVTIGVVRG